MAATVYTHTDFPYTISSSTTSPRKSSTSTFNKSIHSSPPSFRHRRAPTYPTPIPRPSTSGQNDLDDEEDERDKDRIDNASWISSRTSFDSERSSLYSPSFSHSRPMTPPIYSRYTSSTSTSSPASSSFMSASTPSLHGPGPWMYGATASPRIRNAALPTYLPPDPSSPFTTTFHDEDEEEEETILGHHHLSHPPATTAKAQSNTGRRRSSLFSHHRRTSIDPSRPAEPLSSWVLASAEDLDEEVEGGERDEFGSDVEQQAQQTPSCAESARKRWDLFSVRVHLGVFHAKKRLSNLKQGGSSSPSSSSTSTASSTVPSSNPVGLRSPKLTPGSPLMSPPSKLLHF
ncbi:uncharacterized protein EI90DRAFT_3019823 [Cantharellus anzutake]|uniref:uncharacterized protein n=1 Tax=Cantharellus anzutake TaxID=1750568 RepID=UPI001905DAF3|nr:uncharacterized protein EI90DRAFT_3019823 [Cantharellus anzutake]KAF8323458.1 hypothetical protein EI90DRAFT_3019823 [Cantharellus anzutake]